MSVVASPPPGRANSLHAPLPLQLPARRLVLGLLPLPCCLVVLPVNHVRVNLLSGSYRPMAQACGYRGSGTPLASRCEPCE